MMVALIKWSGLQKIVCKFTPKKYGKPHGYSSRSDSTRKTVDKQTSPKINRLC